MSLAESVGQANFVFVSQEAKSIRAACVSLAIVDGLTIVKFVRKAHKSSFGVSIGTRVMLRNFHAVATFI
jgi:hypothetical protein